MDLTFLGLPEGMRLANPEFLLLFLLLAGIVALYILRQVRSAATLVFSAAPVARRIRPTLRVRLRHLLSDLSGEMPRPPQQPPQFS